MRREEVAWTVKEEEGRRGERKWGVKWEVEGRKGHFGNWSLGKG